MEDLTGKQFGSYQIVGPLGEGGMAAVFKAYQPAMERYVAVKVLPRQLAVSKEFVGRFQQEAKLLARLQHPHILPVFDYGETDGYTYIVMPFIQGGTLSDLIEKRRFSLSEAREIISQSGSALGYAHLRGMIHRDVKPSNVLIDESGNCLLTDFGLARMIESTSNLTTSGAIVGTPAYMSPEQGTGRKIDHRSDIYSLGIIFFELLSGRVPYTAETPVAIVFKHIQEPLPSIKKYNPDISTEVEMILFKVLAKNPEDRYQTVDDFLHALEQIDVPGKVPAWSGEAKISDESVRLATEKAAREQAEREAAEKAEREAAEQSAREQAKRLANEALARQQAEREAAALEQARQLSAERAAYGIPRREPVSQPSMSRQPAIKKNKNLGWLLVSIAVFIGGILIFTSLGGLLWLRSTTRAPVKLVLAGQSPAFSFGTDLPFIIKIAFSPDGTQLVSSSIIYDTQLWSLEDGSLLKSYDWGYDFALSKDGKTIATSDLSLHQLNDGNKLGVRFDRVIAFQLLRIVSK
jgi:predicted Ser/Thr protein kinase